MQSNGSSLGLPSNLLEDFIAFIGDALIERTGVRAWAQYALAHHELQAMDEHLCSSLKQFATHLAAGIFPNWEPETCPSRVEKTLIADSVKLVRRYRPKLARYFREKLVSDPSATQSMEARLRALGKQLSLSERFGLFQKTASTGGESDQANIDDAFDETEDFFSDLTSIRDFLISGQAFQKLVNEIRRTLYLNDEKYLQRIDNLISDALRYTKHGSTQLCLCWDLQSFMQTQFGSEMPPISSVITLTGSVYFAQATTCLDYVQKTWPRNGVFV